METRMVPMIELRTLEQLMAFYFEASLIAGWCNPDAEITKWESGMRSVNYERDGLCYDDVWFVGKAMPGPGWSRGNTTISAGDCQVLAMSYGGYYPSTGIDITKDIVMPALLKAYGDSNFVGGRGPELYANPEYPTLTYHNDCSYAMPIGAEKLRHFWGEERVTNQPNREINDTIGWHTYWGMTLGMS